MKTLVLFLLTASAALAQQPTKPVVTLSRSQQAEVRELARKKLENLRSLLNTVTFIDASEFEINTVIKNSFLPPNANQVFLNDGVIIEDDIDPQNVGIGTPVDVPVETYLRNLNLFYTKTEKFSVGFSDIIVRNGQVGTRPIVKVYFTSTFNSKHNQIDKPYQPTQRVAEFQVERVGKLLSVMITHLGFASITNQPPKQVPVGIAKSDSIKTLVPIIKNSSPLPTSIILPDSRVARYKRQGWFMILGGVASFVGGYLAYNKIQTDYQVYTSRVNALNTEYSQWQELSRQPVGGPMTPMGFPAFAGSGGYIVYGAGAAGLGLNIAGIGKLLKARRLAKKQAVSTF